MISVPAIIAFLAVILCFLIRILNLTDRELMPETFDSGSDFVKAIKASCPFLKEKYVPPVWARSGHMQTLFASQVGRVNAPTLLGKHHTVKMKDGATMTFDVYEPEMTKREEKLNTIIIVPGIGNCSDTKYVRTFAGYALNHNFRVAVLDHLGARENIRLTSPRIFTYGSTDELRVLVKQVIARYNCHHLIGVGFSMGANVLLKYLGEKPERQKNFTCAISVCQGYDIISASQLFCDWEGARRFYSFAMAQNMKALILRNEHILFRDPEMCMQKAHVCSATSLNELDEAFNRRMAHFDDIKSFYEENSSCKFMTNIKMPVLLLNARDDPIIPEQLFASPLKHVVSHALTFISQVVVLAKGESSSIVCVDETWWSPRVLRRRAVWSLQDNMDG
ncbi:monoacylglycerol lipase ABHD2-like isoform X2 [Actinia tenebrosa]|uniref:Monoacylglycerol lipase ABHD2-like isoform X2 n=2 Tax=Actinia tenebrosa TaxID=6105 RepID=A0A6P8I5J9_ACTTE|nr:monoacylglycerol lipase ABHD2-like isoform X2 [Actinia tenebrosa]